MGSSLSHNLHLRDVRRTSSQRGSTLSFTRPDRFASQRRCSLSVPMTPRSCSCRVRLSSLSVFPPITLRPRTGSLLLRGRRRSPSWLPWLSPSPGRSSPAPPLYSTTSHIIGSHVITQCVSNKL